MTHYDRCLCHKGRKQCESGGERTLAEATPLTMVDISQPQLLIGQAPCQSHVLTNERWRYKLLSRDPQVPVRGRHRADAIHPIFTFAESYGDSCVSNVKLILDCAIPISRDRIMHTCSISQLSNFFCFPSFCP